MNNIASHKTLAMQAAVEQGLLHENQPHIALVNTQGIIETVQSLQNAFPENTRHCFAVKANPYKKILKVLKKAGMGAEVASSPELELALKTKFPSEQIIFDAPVKTNQEIDRALSQGIDFNLDNFQELERVAEWFEEHSSASNIGFRINPQIDSDSIKSTDSEPLTSKLGIGLNDKGNQKKIIDACQKHPWITCICIQIDSMGSPIESLSKSISIAYSLAEKINASLEKDQISKLDIGGGLAIDFNHDEIPDFAAYAKVLLDTIPEIFDGKYQLTTKFGREIIAKNALSIGRVEYTKTTGRQAIALTHLGVQTFVRTVYDPEHWERRITAFDANGVLKTGNEVGQNITGPACISGDLIARNRILPKLEPNDYILVHDTGAYHFSNHYQYNALPRLPVYGYRIDDNNEVIFKCFSRGQNIMDVISDYS